MSIPRMVSRGGWWGIVLPLLAMGVLLAAVIGSVPGAPSPTPAAGRRDTLFVPAFAHLPPVPEGHYELWVERPDSATEPLAAFSVLPGGQMVTLSGEPTSQFPVVELPSTGSTILLLVEAGREPAIERPERVLLRGAVAAADVRFDSALPSLSGEQVALLLTPTDAQASDTSGVWFAKSVTRAGSAAAGLSVPSPGPGWVYGAFVTTAGGTVLPTGTFTDVGASDASASYSGEGKGLSVPGEDFVQRAPEGVTFPLGLADGRTTVTVGLLPDFARAITEPTIPLLVGRIPFGHGARIPFTLEPVAADALPAGTGTFTVQNP